MAGNCMGHEENQKENKLAMSCKERLEAFYQRPYSKIVDLNVEDEEIIDFGPDVGEEKWWSAEKDATTELVAELSEYIVRESNEEIGTDEALKLAYGCVSRIDLNNKYQTHKSLASYAQLIVAKWRSDHGERSTDVQDN